MVKGAGCSAKCGCSQPPELGGLVTAQINTDSNLPALVRDLRLEGVLMKDKETAKAAGLLSMVLAGQLGWHYGWVAAGAAIFMHAHDGDDR